MQSHGRSCGNCPTASHPATKKGRINTPILPKPARCAKSDRLLDALIDFYRAFNASDLKALGANWADGEAPSMNNPIGGIRRGWPAIREGYAKLFSGPATVRVAFRDFSVQGNNDYHLYVGR